MFCLANDRSFHSISDQPKSFQLSVSSSSGDKSTNWKLDREKNGTGEATSVKEKYVSRHFGL